MRPAFKSGGKSFNRNSSICCGRLCAFLSHLKLENEEKTHSKANETQNKHAESQFKAKS
jgi:hypothetical protein